MQKHVKNYLKFFNIGLQDRVLCEFCGTGCNGIELHHIIYRSHGGSDEVGNIIALCRDCHNKAHNNEISKNELQVIHNLKLLK
jgi:5-methylcytosine-specific restriction endonuclease McrA